MGQKWTETVRMPYARTKKTRTFYLCQWHHCSLSLRCNWMQAPEKSVRLKKEKDMMRERNEEMREVYRFYEMGIAFVHLYTAGQWPIQCIKCNIVFVFSSASFLSLFLVRTIAMFITEKLCMYYKLHTMLWALLHSDNYGIVVAWSDVACCIEKSRNVTFVRAQSIVASGQICSQSLKDRSDVADRLLFSLASLAPDDVQIQRACRKLFDDYFVFLWIELNNIRNKCSRNYIFIYSRREPNHCIV